MIVSNKFLRSNYGKAVRNYLSTATFVERIVDYAGLPVFTGATVRTIVLITSNKLVKKKNILYSPPLTNESFKMPLANSVNIEQVVHNISYKVDAGKLNDAVWNYAPIHMNDLLNKLQNKFSSLQKYSNKLICRGIVSGLTEAFVIDSKTRLKIIKHNKAAGEIIKPFLDGRDVRRYSIESKDIFLIYSFHGIDTEKEPIDRQIAATDKKIDNLAYELYGLMEEEIAIGEGKSS